jgi:hypothetical protein
MISDQTKTDLIHLVSGAFIFMGTNIYLIKYGWLETYPWLFIAVGFAGFIFTRKLV